MNDDLGRRLRVLNEQVPDGDPNLVPVLRGGRKRKLQRRIAGSALAFLVAVTGVVSIPQLIDEDRVPAPDEKNDTADHNDGIFVPAERGEPTYDLYDLEVLYPWAPIDSSGISAARRDAYCSIRSEWQCGHRREQAGFSYQWRWATKEHPGEVQCRVSLSSADGSVVGRAEWQLSGLETQSRRPDVIGVRVSEPPASARAECEAGAYAPGRGVNAEFVRAENYAPTHIEGQSPLPDRIRLIFEAETLVEDHLDDRMCFMTVRFESGRKETDQFTTNQGEGTWEFETGYPASDPVVDAEMRCRAIRANDS